VNMGAVRPGGHGGVTAPAVRITPWMIHGWRPTSVTVQPASMATKPSGLVRVTEPGTTASGKRRRRQSQAPSTAVRPSPTRSPPSPEGQVDDRHRRRSALGTPSPRTRPAGRGR
jgi:hypothetical protein